MIILLLWFCFVKEQHELPAKHLLENPTGLEHFWGELFLWIVVEFRRFMSVPLCRGPGFWFCDVWDQCRRRESARASPRDHRGGTKDRGESAFLLLMFPFHILTDLMCPGTAQDAQLCVCVALWEMCVFVSLAMHGCISSAVHCRLLCCFWIGCCLAECWLLTACGYFLFVFLSSSCFVLSMLTVSQSHACVWCRLCFSWFEWLFCS